MARTEQMLLPRRSRLLSEHGRAPTSSRNAGNTGSTRAQISSVNTAVRVIREASSPQGAQHRRHALGVKTVLRHLQREVDTTVALLGRPSLTYLDASAVLNRDERS